MRPDPKSRLEAKLRSAEPEDLAPVAIHNPPGLAALAYRIDTHPGFLRRMLERLDVETLPDGPHAGKRPLEQLSTQHRDDPAIALLDAWAVACDVLSFYQERIANEAFLRTAVERRSVLELARLVAHELGPGVAASAVLAFTVEESPDAPPQVRVPPGTQVLSIPAQDELPQTFETSSELVARSDWNAMRPRRSRPYPLARARWLFLAGNGTGLAGGDLLLFVVEDRHQKPVHTEVARLVTVSEMAERDCTAVEVEKPLGLPPEASPERIKIFGFRQQAPIFGHNATRYGSLPQGRYVKDDPYQDPGAGGGWDLGRTIWTNSRGVAHRGLSDPTQAAVFLGREITTIVARSWVVFAGRSVPAPASGASWFDDETVALERVYRVSDVSQTTLADYAMSGPATGLALAAGDGTPLTERELVASSLDVRWTTAYVESEALELAEEPITEPFPSPLVDAHSRSLELAARVEGLHAGQLLAVTGERLDDGETVRRVVALQQLDNRDPDHSRLVFQRPLGEDRVVRDTLTVNANLVLAGHGETTREVLGSGNADVTDQQFSLTQLPLTFLPAPIPGGARGALEIRVDGGLWQEVDGLWGEPADRPCYMLQVDDDGRARVRFGDGHNGARLPSGDENVVVGYRHGLGLAGNVGSGALALLQTRPLGISEVINPLPAAGGAPPHTVEQGRATAPVEVRTLGRIVSMSDFEDFARNFAGIGKVRAATLAGVHLTVAGSGGQPVDRGSALYDSLLSAIEAARVPGPQVLIDSYQPIPVHLRATLLADPRWRPDDVRNQVESALLAAFSFDNRDLAQPIHASDVIAVIHRTASVRAVELDGLYFAGSEPRLLQQLPARAARLRGGRPTPAQLLVLDAAGVDLRVKTR